MIMEGQFTPFVKSRTLATLDIFILNIFERDFNPEFITKKFGTLQVYRKKIILTEITVFLREFFLFLEV